MKSIIQRDIKRRVLVKKYEQRRNHLKSIIINLENSQAKRWEAQQSLEQRPFNSNYIRIRNRCLDTGRARSISKLFKRTRVVLVSLLQIYLPYL